MLKSEVITWRQPSTPGGPLTVPRYLGAIGPVTDLVYSWKLMGGPDQMSCMLQLPPNERTDAMDEGRVIQILRGGTVIWDGKIQEAVPAASGTQDGGWQITGTGIGTMPQDFLMIYNTWTNQNDAINQAITRGMRISNPGVPSGVWLGQQQDSGSIFISDLLNLFCQLGGFYWYITVNPTGGGGQLNVVAFPQGVDGPSSALVPNRLVTISVPVPRNVGSDINTLYFRYQSAPTTNNALTNPTFSVVAQKNALQAAQYGVIEAFEDISSAGYQTSGTVQGLETSLLNRFIPVSYSGPIVVAPGDLMTIGGTPIDPGADDMCGKVVQAVVSDYGIGGDVVPGAIIFLVGGYQWDDQNEAGSITPYQSVDMSFQSMLGAISAVASGASRSTTGKTGFWGYGTAAQERAWARAHRHKPVHKHKRHRRRKGTIYPGYPMIPVPKPPPKPRIYPGYPEIPAGSRRRR